MLTELNECGETPDGRWRLVPKEPTRDMAENAREWAQRYWRATGSPGAYLDYWMGGFRAMLAASPSPPSDHVSSAIGGEDEDGLVPVIYGRDPLLDDDGEPIPFSWELSEHTLDHFRKVARAVLSHLRAQRSPSAVSEPVDNEADASSVKTSQAIASGDEGGK